MIAESIIAREYTPQRILFPIWARTPCKEGLAKFANTAKELNPDIRTVMLIDNILPRVLFNRSPDQQQQVDRTYRDNAPDLGFDEIHFLAELEYQFSLLEFFDMCKKFTQNEFKFVIPSHKTSVDGDYNAVDMAEFVWQLGSCRYGLEKLHCDSIIAGMATRHFYYVARKQFPKINIYFTQGKPPPP